MSHPNYFKKQHTIPGGVNSPVRAFAGVGGDPIFIERAEGAYIHDADGKAYVDYVGSWGPMILGTIILSFEMLSLKLHKMD